MQFRRYARGQTDRHTDRQTDMHDYHDYHYCVVWKLVRIGADSTGATGNFAPVLTQEPG